MCVDAKVPASEDATSASVKKLLLKSIYNVYLDLRIWEAFDVLQPVCFASVSCRLRPCSIFFMLFALVLKFWEGGGVRTQYEKVYVEWFVMVRHHFCEVPSAEGSLAYHETLVVGL